MVHPLKHHDNIRHHSLDGLGPFSVVKEAELKIKLSVIHKEMIEDVKCFEDGGQGSSIDGK